MKAKLKYGVIGALAGLLNGFFGAGGGLLVVPMLESRLFAGKDGAIEPTKAHATSIGIIFPLSVISAILYFRNGVSMDWKIFLYSLPLGVIGAVVGSFLLKKIDPKWLKRIFGGVMIISAVRIFFR